MSKYVIGVSLRSRSARLRLEPRTEPYWHSLTKGRQVGYYKGATRGTWIARIRVDGISAKERLGQADDTYDADNERILNFEQALAKASSWFNKQLRSDGSGENAEASQPAPSIPSVGTAVAA